MIRACRYCGCQLQPVGNMLAEADSAGNYGYCPDSPSRAHSAEKTLLRPCPPARNGWRTWDEAFEADLRRQRRELADKISEQKTALEEIRALIGSGEENSSPGPWAEGTCSRCGTQTLVIGPDVQKLCVYCDELRILPPLPVARPAISPAMRERRRLNRSGALAILGLLLIFSPAAQVQVVAVICFALSILIGSGRR